MKKGLVLCGGGAKGSYEAGCFNAFKELGISFDIVCGTSIGCLNAAMYCQHRIEKNNELWNSVDPSMIIKYGFNFDRFDILNGLKNNPKSISLILNYMTNRGVDIRPLIKLIDKYVDEDLIHSSDIKFGIVVSMFSSMKGQEVVANKLSGEQIKKYMLASASCWPVFPVCKINGKNYVDGGYYDNLPINFAIKLGADEIVAIDLNVTPTHPEYMHKSYVKYIKPTHVLGGFMQYDHDQMVKNMRIGYLDTLKAYKKYEGFRYTFVIEQDNTLYLPLIKRISEVYSYIAKASKSVRKTLITNNIFETISKYTENADLSNRDIYIRCLEIAAETFKIDYTKIYKKAELLNLIIDEIKNNYSNLDDFENYTRLKPNKKKDFLAKTKNQFIVSYLYNNKHITIIDLSSVYQIKLEALISYLLLEFATKMRLIDENQYQK